MTDQDLFSTETAGLPYVARPQVIQLADGDRYGLSIGPVREDLDGDDGDADLRMLAYNGPIPGPTLRVPQGARVTVDVRDHGDVETTAHRHGLRLENRSTAFRTRPKSGSRSAAATAARCSSPTSASPGTTRTCARSSRSRTRTCPAPTCWPGTPSAAPTP